MTALLFDHSCFNVKFSLSCFLGEKSRFHQAGILIWVSILVFSFYYLVYVTFVLGISYSTILAFSLSVSCLDKDFFIKFLSLNLKSPSNF
jgi:hypothetical protein